MSAFPDLHRQRLPGKDSIDIRMTIWGSRNKFDGFIHGERRPAAG
jgi:hypothetical protein